MIIDFYFLPAFSWAQRDTQFVVFDDELNWLSFLCNGLNYQVAAVKLRDRWHRRELNQNCPLDSLAGDVWFECGRVVQHVRVRANARQ